LTLWKSGSYTRGSIRPICPIALLALAACATPTGAHSELPELQAEVRALRAENKRLESRLDRLELHDAVSAHPAAAGTGVVPGFTVPEPAPEKMPALTVVKLKPRAQAAPKLPTQVAVTEPDPVVITNLKPAADPAGPPEDDQDMGEALFDHGVAALKTGNVEKGVAELQQFAADSPRHPRADNALYFSGLGLMGLSDYVDAARAFEDVVARYPAGDAVLDSMLKLAECRLKLNKPADAKSVYQKIVASYPGTPAATTAQARLSSLSP
jgi:tol-pal system protein YbgF